MPYNCGYNVFSSEEGLADLRLELSLLCRCANACLLPEEIRGPQFSHKNAKQSHPAIGTVSLSGLIFP